MGTINNGLHTFSSLIICLIAKPRGTAGEADVHLCTFPHSAFGATRAEAERDLAYEENGEGGSGCDTREDPGCQSLESFVDHLSKKCVMFIISNF